MKGGIPINSELSYEDSPSPIVRGIGPEHPLYTFNSRIAPFHAQIWDRSLNLGSKWDRSVGVAWEREVPAPC